MAQIGDRSAFPRLGARSYLNHAGVSPPSIWVEAAVSAAVQAYASRGVDAIPDEVARRERLRGAAAALIGAPAAQIALTGGATRALIDLAACLQWKAGDRMLVFEGEFPANVTPWQAAALR